MVDRKHWEQLEGEPKEAYARFLVYRNLGIARSLDRAYADATSMAPKRPKSHQASGQWKDDSSKWRWAERAAAWDISVLTEVGQGVVAKYVNALDLAFGRIIESLDSGRVRPGSWRAVIDSIMVLGGFIPQETVATIRQNNAGNSVPAIGYDSRAAEETGKTD